MLNNKTIILGVCGGISAYKTCEIASALKKLNADVWVAMTDSAQKFVTPLAFRTLTSNPAITDLFNDEMSSLPVPHISLSQKADLIVIAPASANMIGKIANGLADDALSTIVISSKCRKLLAPAMNSQMWLNPIVHENVSRLLGLGYTFIGPEEGHLACGGCGIGRMSEPEKIIEKIIGMLAPRQDLLNHSILITAGGTQEDIDPVRFIGNKSSGKMGYSIACSALARGAQVTLISGPTKLASPKGADVVHVTSSKEMHEEVMKRKGDHKVIIMAAAVSDYKPKVTFMQKLKKDDDEFTLELSKTQDILEALGKSKNGTYLVGFSLESENMIENAKEKLEKKNLDMMIANDVSAFGDDYSEITIIDKHGHVERFLRAKKTDLADRILDRIFARHVC